MAKPKSRKNRKLHKKNKKRTKVKQNISQNKNALKRNSDNKRIIKNSYENRGLLGLYVKYHKILLLIPILLLLGSIIQISFQYHKTGDFIKKGISLTGGTEIFIYKHIDDYDNFVNYLKTTLGDFRISEIKELGELKGYDIETSMQDSYKIKEILSKKGIASGDISLRTTGSELSKSFFKEIIKALLLAFVFMAIVVFLRFKTPAVSLAVILSALSDMLVTISVLNLMNFKFSMAGIAALLMLIGYSVDTDILLSTRMVKEKGNKIIKFVSAFKTGITMTLTTFITVIIGYLISNSSVIKEIMLVLMIGLIVDIVNTWIQNASLLFWYLDRTKKRR